MDFKPVFSSISSTYLTPIAPTKASCWPQLMLGAMAFFGAALFLDNLLGGPRVYIEKAAAVYSTIILAACFVAAAIWSLTTARPKSQNGILPLSGPYRWLRYPFLSAILFLLVPALAIFVRSWLMLIAILPLSFLWRKCLKAVEENQGPQPEKSSLPLLLPSLHRINKAFFYLLWGAVIFAAAFVVLNFSAVYLRWVAWEKEKEITYDEEIEENALAASLFENNRDAAGIYQPQDYILPFPSDNTETSQERGLSSIASAAQSMTVQPRPEQNITVNSLAPDYSEQPNSIKISKIKIKAPLVFAAGVSQKELNDALNQGVLIYPGSGLPGQNREVFLTGHSSVFPWTKTSYGQVFTRLDKLEPGDIVSLVYEHRQYDYRVREKQILPPEQVKISNDNQPILTLMTCWPIGTALKRLVVRADLIR